jgi:hypothetical protein
MKKPSKYFGSDVPQTVGRTRLFTDGGTPTNDPVPAAENPVRTESPVEPFHAPERRRWQKKREKAQKHAAPTQTPETAPEAAPASPVCVTRGDGAEWGPEREHTGCGGKVTITRAGASGLDAACTCGKTWLMRRGCGGWQRG